MPGNTNRVVTKHAQFKREQRRNGEQTFTNKTVATELRKAACQIIENY